MSRLMELLAPLARRSRIVTALLSSEMGVLTRLLTVVTEPITLSLGEGQSLKPALSLHFSIARAEKAWRTGFGLQ